jgi:signal transduction histidine kinase
MALAIHGNFARSRRSLRYDLNMDAPPTGCKPAQWLWIASIWLSIALFSASQNVLVMQAEGMRHLWTRLFAAMLLSWLIWALVTPLVLGLGRQYPPVRLRPISAWLSHVAACAVIGLVSAAWSAWLEELMNPFAKSPDPGPFLPLWLDTFYNGLLQTLFLYAALVAISYTLESRARLVRQQIETARLNERLSKAQLDALRRQVEPHFLFNTLNAIAGLVREKRNDAAVSMIVGLSEFLRKVVEDSNRQQAPLGEEMEFLQRYLDIQKVRFADRLQVSVNVPKELLPAQVPTLILQPMVENAVKHGIAKRAQGGAIRITAFRSNGMLTVSVYNDGPKLAEDWEKTRSGIGVSNVRTRLQCQYGDAFELSMRNQDPGGVMVSVSVPFREG